jgi:uncharacterized damage-inducible protein DinB
LVRGIPALFPQADWTVLHALSGDRGARDLFVLPDTLSVFLRNGSFDVDTPADLVRWRAESPPPPFLPRPMSALAQTALADLDHEIANTRRVLERVPADHLDFTPHAKSWPLQKLANHLTDFGMWGEITLATDVLDFAAPMPPNPPAPTTAEGFLAQFDERIARFKALLDQATDAQLMATWTMKNGDAVIMAMPRIAVLRSFIINHMIHHRAQLDLLPSARHRFRGSAVRAPTKRCDTRYVVRRTAPARPESRRVRSASDCSWSARCPVASRLIASRAIALRAIALRAIAYRCVTSLAACAAR